MEVLQIVLNSFYNKELERLQKMESIHSKQMAYLKEIPTFGCIRCNVRKVEYDVFCLSTSGAVCVVCAENEPVLSNSIVRNHWDMLEMHATTLETAFAEHDLTEARCRK